MDEQDIKSLLNQLGKEIPSIDKESKNFIISNFKLIDQIFRKIRENSKKKTIVD